MKKVFMLIACLVLVLFSAGVVSADDPAATPTPTPTATPTASGGSQTGHTTVMYSVSSAYILTVPAQFYVGDTEGHLSIEISDAVIESDQKVIVTVSSSQFTHDIDDGNSGQGLWTMLSQNGDPLYYHIHKKVGGVDTPVKNGEIAYEATGDEFAALNAGVDGFGIVQYLYLHIHSVQAYSGQYSDYLSFTASIVQA